MWFLALSSLRFRWLSFIGVLVTVMAAAMLVTATGALLEGGIRGAVTPDRLTGAHIVVVADQNVSETRGHGEDRETVSAAVIERVRIPTDLAEEISSVPGVAGVVADVSFPAYLVVNGEQVAGPDGTPSLGHSWTSSSVTPFHLEHGDQPTSTDEVVIDSALANRTGLAVGDHTSAVVSGHTVELTVAGIAEPAAGRTLTEQASVFFSEDAARTHYAQSGQADLLAVTVSNGADIDTVATALDEALGDEFVVLTGDERGKAEFLESSESSIRLIAISGSLGGIALFVAALVLAGMITLFVQQRLREIALLRAIGGTPRQVRRLLAYETVTVTLLGALAGIWPGFWLGRLLAEAMQGKGLLPGTFETQASIWPPVAAIAAVLLVSRVAAYISGRRAGRVRPIEALMDSASPPNRIGWIRALAGVLCAGGTAALFLVAMSVRPSIAPALAPATLMAAVVTVALFAPVLVAVGVRTVGIFIRPVFGASGFLALANARTQVRRVASAVIPLALTVGVAGMTLFQQSTLEDESQAQSNDRVTAEHVVAAGEAGLPPEIVDELAAKSSSHVIGLVDTSVYANSELDPYLAKVVLGDTLTDLLDVGVVSGSLATLDGGEVALSEDAAAGIDAKVGEPVNLRLGDGTQQDLRLVATYDKSLGFADVLLPWASVHSHLTDPVLSLVLVDDGGDDPAAAAEAVEDLNRDHPAAVTGGADIIAAVEDANADTQAWVNYLLLGLVIAFAAFAVFNTLMLAIRGRSREYALLQLVGASRRQVRRMMRVEALLLVVLGWTIGSAVAAATMMPFAYAVTGSFLPAFPSAYVGAVLVSTALLAWLATMAPTRGTMRARPVDAIGIRD
jgi:putative ABC transport system permease protein